MSSLMNLFSSSKKGKPEATEGESPPDITPHARLLFATEQKFDVPCCKGYLKSKAHDMIKVMEAENKKLPTPIDLYVRMMEDPVWRHYVENNVGDALAAQVPLDVVEAIRSLMKRKVDVNVASIIKTLEPLEYARKRLFKDLCKAKNWHQNEGRLYKLWDRLEERVTLKNYAVAKHIVTLDDCDSLLRAYKKDNPKVKYLTLDENGLGVVAHDPDDKSVLDDEEVSLDVEEDETSAASYQMKHYYRHRDSINAKRRERRKNISEDKLLDRKFIEMMRTRKSRTKAKVLDAYRNYGYTDEVINAAFQKCWDDNKGCTVDMVGKYLVNGDVDDDHTADGDDHTADGDGHSLTRPTKDDDGSENGEDGSENGDDGSVNGDDGSDDGNVSGDDSSDDDEDGSDDDEDGDDHDNHRGRRVATKKRNDDGTEQDSSDDENDKDLVRLLDKHLGHSSKWIRRNTGMIEKNIERNTNNFATLATCRKLSRQAAADKAKATAEKEKRLRIEAEERLSRRNLFASSDNVPESAIKAMPAPVTQEKPRKAVAFGGAGFDGDSSHDDESNFSHRVKPSSGVPPKMPRKVVVVGGAGFDGGSSDDDDESNSSRKPSKAPKTPRRMSSKKPRGMSSKTPLGGRAGGRGKPADMPPKTPLASRNDEHNMVVSPSASVSIQLDSTIGMLKGNGEPLGYWMENHRDLASAALAKIFDGRGGGYKNINCVECEPRARLFFDIFGTDMWYKFKEKGASVADATTVPEEFQELVRYLAFFLRARGAFGKMHKDGFSVIVALYQGSVVMDKKKTKAYFEKEVNMMADEAIPTAK